MFVNCFISVALYDYAAVCADFLDSIRQELYLMPDTPLVYVPALYCR